MRKWRNWPWMNDLGLRRTDQGPDENVDLSVRRFGAVQRSQEASDLRNIQKKPKKDTKAMETSYYVGAEPKNPVQNEKFWRNRIDAEEAGEVETSGIIRGSCSACNRTSCARWPSVTSQD